MKRPVMFDGAVGPQAQTHSNALPTVIRRVPATMREVAPQVKRFMTCDGSLWLLAELDYDDVAFGKCDPGQAFSELGYGVNEVAAP
jgi:hypothetical protein